MYFFKPMNLREMSSKSLFMSATEYQAIDCCERQHIDQPILLQNGRRIVTIFSQV